MAPPTLNDKLVVAISSRALFDFEEENRVFEHGDDRAYVELQRQRLDIPAPPGVAFSLVRKLLAFNHAEHQRVEVVLLDVRMGAFHGPDLYGDLCARWQQHPLVVLVTAERDNALRRQAAERGWGFLLKPVRPSALRALISQMLLRQSKAGAAD